MEYTQAEILQTVRMTEMEHLDIRTVTLSLSLRDCVGGSVAETARASAPKLNARQHAGLDGRRDRQRIGASWNKKFTDARFPDRKRRDACVGLCDAQARD
ncbi:MAG: hypothetical protein WKF30_08170 [Pyrinomonadaceae bacterium]